MHLTSKAGKRTRVRESGYSIALCRLRLCNPVANDEANYFRHILLPLVTQYEPTSPNFFVRHRFDVANRFRTGGRAIAGDL